jgi:putative ABC transport system substrate-binding protein
MWCSVLGCIVTLALGILIAPLAIEAQSPGKAPRVGFLRHARQVDEPRQGRLEEFRHGLRELGYIEGQNILLEVRYTEENTDRLAELAAEIVRLKVDIIVTHGAGVRAAREATSTIPIVMARIDDADTHGYVASLAQPGGNITGLSFQTGELSGKWLELLKEAVPSLSRVAVLFPEGAGNQRHTLEHRSSIFQ